MSRRAATVIFICLVVVVSAGLVGCSTARPSGTGTAQPTTATATAQATAASIRAELESRVSGSDDWVVEPSDSAGVFVVQWIPQGLDSPQIPKAAAAIADQVAALVLATPGVKAVHFQATDQGRTVYLVTKTK